MSIVIYDLHAKNMIAQLAFLPTPLQTISVCSTVNSPYRRCSEPQVQQGLFVISLTTASAFTEKSSSYKDWDMSQLSLNS
jgi:hypothetical protein